MNTPAIGRPMEILMVEDSLSDARLAAQALDHGGIVHRFTLVRDGEEALYFLFNMGIFAKAPRPDIVLLDLALPKIDGRQVLNEIKSDHNLNTVPVVVMTSSQHDEDIVRSQLRDADCFMTKPVDLEKFLSVVKALKAYWPEDVILPIVN